MREKNWAKSKWAFFALVFLIIAISVVVSLKQRQTVEKGERVAVFTYYKSKSQKIHSQYSYFSNGRLEKLYHTGGPPSLRWTPVQNIQNLVSNLSSRQIWNRKPAIRNPLSPGEQEAVDRLYSGNTNAYLQSIAKTPPGSENFDEEIELIENEGTNRARFLPIEYQVTALNDTNFAFAKRQCIYTWNIAEPNLWKRLKDLVR